VVGRPRRFEPETEVRLILDAALEVMRRNGYADASVSDILHEAGLSTRSFYRHFESKDDLVRALYRRDAESAGRRLVARVEAAGTPRASLEVWIDEILSFVYDRRRAERFALLSSDGARRAVGTGEEQRLGFAALIDPLVKLLNDGRADGSFPAAEPERDARTIRAVVWEIMDWARTDTSRVTRRDAVAHALRFCLPALGATGAARG
jgi:AcrR family transcriptional regulator